MAKRSRILDNVYETANGFKAAGFISARRMKEYEELCIPEIYPYTPKQIKRLRGNLSQTVFAHVLNTSPSTIQKWEIGVKLPSGPSLKLLNLIEKKGIEILL